MLVPLSSGPGLMQFFAALGIIYTSVAVIYLIFAILQCASQ